MKVFVLLLIIWATIHVLATCGVKASGSSDPDPRIEYLGSEVIKQPDTQGQPYRVFYKDRATNEEVECFAGSFRETLSCFKSGRIR